MAPIGRQGELTYALNVRDLGITKTCVSRWVHTADIEGGKRPWSATAEAAEMGEAREGIRNLEQENPALAPGGDLSGPRHHSKRVYPLAAVLSLRGSQPSGPHACRSSPSRPSIPGRR